MAKPLNSSNVIVIIQARMGSSRLPGKSLADIEGQPMLARVVERVLKAEIPDLVIVATSNLKQDDPIVSLCHYRKWPIFRGSEDNVLDRYFRCMTQYKGSIVIRVTADCPLIDPELIDQVIQKLFDTRTNYCSNVAPRTYPKGLDVEAFTGAALSKIWRDAKDDDEKEHVTLYVHNHPDQFSISNVSATRDYSSHRWTVDTRDDLERVRRIFQIMGRDYFPWCETLEKTRSIYA